MELHDCAFPTLAGVLITDDPNLAFTGVDYALLVGSKPRGKGMERSDLLKDNGAIFKVQGKALSDNAKGADTRVLIVGNPANTNAMICQQSASKIPARNFSALMKLDHNRSLSQLSSKVGCKVSDISRFVVWGNHSATQYPDISHATIQGKLATDVITDTKWLNDVFIPQVQQRGAAIINARGSSSAASAAAATVDAIHDWHFGTVSEWTSAAHVSSGEYGVTPGLFYSYPTVYEDKEWDVVRDLPITEASAILMEKTHKELLADRDAVSKLLG